MYQGLVSRRSRKVFPPRKPQQNLEAYDYRAALIHVFLVWTEVPFIQKVSGIYTSPFLDTDELKMALRTQEVSGDFEKRAPGHQNNAELARFET